MKFKDNFIFGGATSAYQAEGAVNEGNKGKVCWDVLYHKKDSKFNADVASDFYHKYKDDLELSSKFGVNGIRISIAWSRIIPNGTGEVSKHGIKYYHNLIDECLKNGIEPFVTLHHFDTPLPLFENGDWLNEKTIDAFFEYAKICFEEFGSKVSKWITINEPYSVAAGSYIIGHFPPHIKYDVVKALRAILNMGRAHARVAKYYQSLNLNGEIGIVHILESKYPICETNNLDIKAANNEHIIANVFALEAAFKDGFSKETIATVNKIANLQNQDFIISENDLADLKNCGEATDFLGINYYASHFIKHYDGESNIVHNGTGKKGSSVFALKGIGERGKKEGVETTLWDWPIYPQGLYEMIMYVTKTYLNCSKIYITENGMADKDDFIDGKIFDYDRIDYIQKHLNAILKANNDGANVCGYFLWSLMDVFSWTNNYSKRYGLLYVDFETQQRYVKLSAHFWKELSINKTLDIDIKKLGENYANS